MRHFADLGRLGAAVAALSERSDGDGASHSEERPALLARCGVPLEALATVRQVHGTVVVRAAPGERPEADGLITDAPGIVLGITVADCVPVFLWDPVRRAAGLLHAGRAGTRANIAAAGVEALREAYGSAPEEIVAVIGPSAGPCCYEVDEATAEDFQAGGLPAGGRLLDLWQANRRQLMAAGLKPERIAVDGYCTICGDAFHSYRAQGTAKRNLALLGA